MYSVFCRRCPAPPARPLPESPPRADRHLHRASSAREPTDRPRPRPQAPDLHQRGNQTISRNSLANTQLLSVTSWLEVTHPRPAEERLPWMVSPSSVAVIASPQDCPGAVSPLPTADLPSNGPGAWIVCSLHVRPLLADTTNRPRAGSCPNPLGSTTRGNSRPTPSPNPRPTDA